MDLKAQKKKSKIRKIFEDLKEFFLFRKENNEKFDVSEKGFKELKSNHPNLFEVARTFMLDYSQKWDERDQKDQALKEVLRYVGLPMKLPKRRGRKVLKRDFKNELRKIKRDDLTLEIVRVANILDKYKKKVQKEKDSHKKIVKE